jgi:hypothetical protein
MKRPPMTPEQHQEGRLWYVGTRVADPDPHYFEEAGSGSALEGKAQNRATEGRGRS